MQGWVTRRFGKFMLAGLVWSLGSAFALAQSGPPMNPTMGPGPGRPDLSGYWTSGLRAGGSIFSENPPMTPEYARIRARNRAGLTSPREQGLDELDPLTWCYPVGPTRAMVLRQFQIVQTPEKTLFLTEWDSSNRHIFTDGREHPPGWPFGWMGHSIGKYEDDTLVVDTVGLNGVPWLDFSGTPYSDALHIVERYRRTAPDRLEVNLTFNDPATYTRPWTGSYAFRLQPRREIAEHVVCEEWLEFPTDPRP